MIAWLCELPYIKSKKYRSKIPQSSNQTPIYTMISTFKISHMEFYYYESSQENSKQNMSKE